jgi:hypothetical protein
MFFDLLVLLDTVDCALVPLPQWHSGIMGSVESASIPVPLAWIHVCVDGLAVGSGLRPWWQNADLSWLGIRDLVLRQDVRGGYTEFLRSAGTLIWPEGLGSSDPGNNHKGTVLPICELGCFRGSFIASPGQPGQEEPIVKQRELVSG